MDALAQAEIRNAEPVQAMDDIRLEACCPNKAFSGARSYLVIPAGKQCNEDGTWLWLLLSWGELLFVVASVRMLGAFDLRVGTEV